MKHTFGTTINGKHKNTTNQVLDFYSSIPTWERVWSKEKSTIYSLTTLSDLHSLRYFFNENTTQTFFLERIKKKKIERIKWPTVRTNSIRAKNKQNIFFTQGEKKKTDRQWKENEENVVESTYLSCIRSIQSPRTRIWCFSILKSYSVSYQTYQTTIKTKQNKQKGYSQAHCSFKQSNTDKNKEYPKCVSIILLKELSYFSFCCFCCCWKKSSIQIAFIHKKI